jgi:small-conductance mechanosensitive channel
LIFASILGLKCQAFVVPSRATSPLTRDTNFRYDPKALQLAPKAKATTTLAGRMWPFLKKFKITPTIAKEIAVNVKTITEWQDILFLSLLAFGSKPLAKLSFKDLVGDEEKEEEEEKRLPFDKHKRFAVSQFLSEIGKLALTVYAFDVVCVVLSTLGFQFVNKWGLASAFAKSAYTIWGLQKFLLWKKIAFCKFFKVREDDMGRVEIADRIVNGLSIALVTLLLLDWLSVKMGMAFKGFFALGSVGTLAFTLGSQKLVSQLLSGIALTLSNKMYVGDVVQFGDGTSGKVMKLGWMELVLRGPDNVITNVRC